MNDSKRFMAGARMPGLELRLTLPKEFHSKLTPPPKMNRETRIRKPFKTTQTSAQHSTHLHEIYNTEHIIILTFL